LADGQGPRFAQALAGRWRIVEMGNWDNDLLDLVGHFYIHKGDDSRFVPNTTDFFNSLLEVSRQFVHSHIFQEGRLVGLKAVFLEIGQRKRKVMVDTHQRGRILCQSFDQPFGDAARTPVRLGLV
jgi:hypothetical protein